MENRRKGIVLSYAKIVVNMVSGLLLSVLLLRQLGDAEYGIYQTVSAFAGYLVLLEFGMGTVMVRNLSACRGENGTQLELQHQATTIWTLAGGLCLLIALLAAAFCALIPWMYARTMTPLQLRQGQEILLLLTGHVVASFLSQTALGVLLAFEHYRFAAVEGMVRTVLRVVVLAVGLCYWQDARLVAAADMVLSIAGLAVTWCYTGKKTGVFLRFGMPDQGILRSVLPLATAIFLQAIVNQAYHNVDKMLIGALLSPERVAVYAVGLYIFSVFSSLTTVPISLYGPRIVQSVQRGEALLPQLRQPCQLTALIGGGVLFGFLAAGRPFVRLFYGQAYLQAWPIALLLMGSIYLNAVSGVLVNALDASNKRMGRSVILLGATALNVALTVAFLPRWGVLGAAVATAVATLLGQVLLGGIHYQKVLGISMKKLYSMAFQGILPWLVIGGAAGLLLSWRGEGIVSMMLSGGVFLLFLWVPTRKMLKNRDF